LLLRTPKAKIPSARMQKANITTMFFRTLLDVPFVGFLNKISQNRHRKTGFKMIWFLIKKNKKLEIIINFDIFFLIRNNDYF